MSDTNAMTRLMEHAADLCASAIEMERHRSSLISTTAALANAEATLRMVAACVRTEPEPTFEAKTPAVDDAAEGDGHG